MNSVIWAFTKPVREFQFLSYPNPLPPDVSIHAEQCGALIFWEVHTVNDVQVVMGLPFEQDGRSSDFEVSPGNTFA